uniref:matrix Gla protein n=1 Tax=Pristiophorus japonicus TaxID=55135 RepID=UPI00398E83BB
MRTLTLLSLCTLAAVVIADSSESNEIDDLFFLGHRDANAFMRQPRPINPWESSLNRYKTPRELNRERCEEYRPCDRLARQVGLKRAYGKFFGRRQQPSSYRQQRPRRQRAHRSRKQYYRY